MSAKDSPHKNLARNLQAARMAVQMGISLGYALKQYVPEETDPFWLDLAEMLKARWLDHMNQLGELIFKPEGKIQ